VVTITAATALVGAATSAQAHVKVVSYTPAVQGSYGVLVFRVPTEENANTVELQVQIPTDTPLSSVDTQPVPGWTASLTTTKLATPLKTSHGTIDEVVSSITWKADPGGGIPPNQFQEFAISAGPLPDVATMAFPAVQTYSNGDVVRWIEPTPAGGPEPDHPVPTLHLVGKNSTSTAADNAPDAATPDAPSVAAAAPSESDDTARALGIAGIVLGALGLLAGGAVLAHRRRTSAP
jgi:uncharacterized protein YcnI